MKTEIQKRLFALQDLPYRDFQSRLLPTVEKDKIIGVRTPALRRLAKELVKDMESSTFLKKLPHRYYEENNLHGFLIEQVKEYDACIALLDAFLPFVDNWATCDMMCPAALKKHPAELLDAIKRWMASGETYTIRFGIGLLMKFYLDELFEAEYLSWVAQVRTEEYYVKMMVAWYFATALAKQYEVVLPYLEEHRMEKWVHNKTIQKACESYRIAGEQKAYLRTLKRT